MEMMLLTYRIVDIVDEFEREKCVVIVLVKLESFGQDWMLVWTF